MTMPEQPARSPQDAMLYTPRMASFACEINYDSLPAQTAHAAKRLILDSVGCAIGGLSTDGGRIAAEVADTLGGHPQATILGTRTKSSVVNAAFANGQASLALDADHILLNHGHHGCAVVMPALAIGEWLGASGRDVLTAATAGYEVAARIGLALRRHERDDQGNLVHAATTGLSWGIFGAAVAAGRLLGLDAVRMNQALGIAGHIAPIPTSGRFLRRRDAPDPSVPMSKYVMQGSLAEGGIKAALLAQAGFTGDLTILDGDNGFWKLAGALGYEWDFLTSGLGERWLIDEDAFKPYPANRHCNAAIALFVDLIEEYRLAIEDIEHVDAGLNPTGFRQGLGTRSFRTEIDTQFCLPYLLAVVALGVPPGPGWHRRALREDPRVAAFMERVDVHLDDSTVAAVEAQLNDGNLYRLCPVSMTIKANGRVLHRRADYTKGDPWSPDTVMSDEELTQKFVNFTADRIDEPCAKRACGIILSLEGESDLDGLVEALTPGRPC